MGWWGVVVKDGMSFGIPHDCPNLPRCAFGDLRSHSCHNVCFDVAPQPEGPFSRGI